jgi:hypothetical protein
MWDNDFKAWKKNPNNGIFRYLEMVSAILDAAQMPAFEVFGGPHARDTDEIIKNVSSGVKEYLEASLKDFKDFKNRKKKASQKRERIINRKAFESLHKVYNLIRTYFDPTPLDLGIDAAKHLDAFFFLYTWTDLSGNNSLRKPGIPEIAGSIKQLALKIINTVEGFEQQRYFSYFNAEFPELIIQKVIADKADLPSEIFFTEYGNLLLILAYQLNTIIPFYELYRLRRKILLYSEPETVERGTGGQKKENGKTPDVVKTNETSDSASNLEQKEKPPFRLLSDEDIYNMLEKYFIYALQIKVIDNTIDFGVENQSRFTKNTLSGIYKNTVECFSKLVGQYKAVKIDSYGKIESSFVKVVFPQLKKIINRLQGTAEFLLTPLYDTIGKRPAEKSYYIDENQKKIIQKLQYSALLQISREWADEMNDTISCLETIMVIIEKLPKTSDKSHASNDHQADDNKNISGTPNKIDFTKMRVSRELVKHQLRPNNTAPVPNSDIPKE